MRRRRRDYTIHRSTGGFLARHPTWPLFLLIGTLAFGPLAFGFLWDFFGWGYSFDQFRHVEIPSREAAEGGFLAGLITGGVLMAISQYLIKSEEQQRRAWNSQETAKMLRSLRNEQPTPDESTDGHS